MIAVRLNGDAVDALGRLQQHRRRMQTLSGRDADDAREQVRSYAVDIVNAVLKEHPELSTGAEVLDELLATGGSVR